MLVFNAMFKFSVFEIVKSNIFFSEEAINRDAEMCNAAMEQGNPQV